MRAQRIAVKRAAPQGLRSKHCSYALAMWSASRAAARSPTKLWRGAEPRAFLTIGIELELIAIIMTVLPSVIVRTITFATRLRLRDQRKRRIQHRHAACVH